MSFGLGNEKCKISTDYFPFVLQVNFSAGGKH